MRRALVLSLTLAIVLLFTTISQATSVGFGARAVAMGGAFTAIADDGTAPYWNPAGITQVKYLAFTPSFGLEGDYDKLLNLVKKMNNKEMPAADDLNQNYELSGLLGLTSNYLAFNVFSDTTLSFNQNSDGDIQGLCESYNYAALTIASVFDYQLAIGFNAKMVYSELQTLNQPTVPSRIVQPTLNTTSNIMGDGMACDLGLLYRYSRAISLGFMARNFVNSIKWHDGTYTTYNLGVPTTSVLTSNQSLPTSYTAGIAYHLSKSITLATDVEMVDSYGTDNDETKVRVGFEQTALWDALALRLGAYTNKSKPTGLTGGVGLKLGPLLLDLAVVHETNLDYYLTGGLKF